MNTRNVANSIFNTLLKFETILKNNDTDIQSTQFMIDMTIKPAIEGMLVVERVITNQLVDLRNSDGKEKEYDSLIIDVELPATLILDDESKTEFHIVNHVKNWSTQAGFEQWMKIREKTDTNVGFGRELEIHFFQDNTYMLKAGNASTKTLKEGKVRDLVIRKDK